MQVKFTEIYYGSHIYKKAILLREEILRKPLGLSLSIQELELEKEQIHIAGLTDDAVVATAILVPCDNGYKMRQVAVAKGLHGSGIGSKLIKFCEEYAVENGVKLIFCHARESAIPFYLKNGYITEGEIFDENTIPHIKMLKNLHEI